MPLYFLPYKKKNEKKKFPVTATVTDVSTPNVFDKFIK